MNVQSLVEMIESLPDYRFEGTDLINKYVAIEIIKSWASDPAVVEAVAKRIYDTDALHQPMPQCRIAAKAALSVVTGGVK